MISKASTVDGFMKTLSADDRAIFTKLRALFKKYAPDTEAMRWGFPSYVAGAQMIGAFGKQKNYLCLYANPKAVDPYRKALGKLDCGKSCIRFRKPEDLRLDIAEKIIKAAAKLGRGRGGEA
jgi:uncharacterized protein YdhG (YjbR/CyaY superfamily)